MTFSSKLKWSLGILMVFILIIATNLIDKNNFTRVKDSVVSIYQDRLVAKDLIFKISNSIREKEVALAVSDSIFFLERNKVIMNDIHDYILQFEQTKLTVKEGNILEDFKKNLASLSNSEDNFSNSQTEDKATLFKNISEVQKNLYDLAKIQLSEGKRQVSISEKAISSVELFTQIEIYILILLAIIILFIIIYNPKKE
ncbi:chemotaxis protein [uncultured Polaribacter sp.]|uniref:chemotaxis protein n=1 Tax=uncultured Polaribacter sp. TaxID=174711 RepID=UPI0026351183|nr:chemotaxis protein [uncultured Polaribacter sp.]